MIVSVRKFSSRVVLFTLLLSPTAIIFIKLLLLSYFGITEEFGRYGLYSVSAVFITYIFNSGLYEGHLIAFSNYLRSGRANRLDHLQANAECLSIAIFVVIFLGWSVAIISIDFAERWYLLGMVMLSYANAHFNLSTCSDRVRERLKAVSRKQLFRAAISSSFALFAFLYFKSQLSVVFFVEAVVLFIYTVISIGWNDVRIIDLYRRITGILKTARLGMSFCYMSAVKSGTLFFERFGASLLLAPTDFGRYSKAQLIYQILSTFGSASAQILQQRLILAGLKRGVGQVGLRLLRVQIGVVIGIGAAGVIIMTVIRMSAAAAVVEKLTGYVGVIPVTIIMFSGLINGSNFFDSLALSTAKPGIFIKYSTIGIFTWLVIWWTWINLSAQWSITSQAIAQCMLAVTFVVSNLAFSRAVLTNHTSI